MTGMDAAPVGPKWQIHQEPVPAVIRLLGARLTTVGPLGGRSGRCAQATRPPFGVLQPLGLLAFLAARLAGGSPLDGRALAAANAEPGGDPRLLAALAPAPGALPLRVGIRTAIGQPRCLAGGVVRTVRSPAT